MGPPNPSLSLPATDVNGNNTPPPTQCESPDAEPVGIPTDVNGKPRQPESPDSQPVDLPMGVASLSGASAQPPSKTNDQRAKHRENSRAWHSKWISKGVPRISETSTENKVVKKDSNKSSSSKGDKKECKAPVDPENAPLESLAKTRDQFITKWISTSNMPPSNERRKAAMSAWMESPLRAELIAARAGVQK